MRNIQFQGKHFAPASVLRHNQITDLEERKAKCELQLEAAMRGVPDINVPYVRKELHSIEDMLLKQTAKPFDSDELDDAIAEEKELRHQLIDEIPSDKEMRHASSAAISKHLRWEQLNKPKIMYWKGLRMRLDKSGVDLGVDKSNTANLEVYRPLERKSDTSFDDAAIPVKEFHKVPDMSGIDKPEPVADNTPALDVAETTIDPDVEWKLAKPAIAEVLTPTVVTGGAKEATSDRVRTIFLDTPFFSLKKQVKNLTGVSPKNKKDALSLLSKAGIKYIEQHTNIKEN